MKGEIRLMRDLTERHSPALRRQQRPGVRALRTDRTTAPQHAEHNVTGDFGDAQALYFGGDMDAAIALSGQVAGRGGPGRAAAPLFTGVTGPSET